MKQIIILSKTQPKISLTCQYKSPLERHLLRYHGDNGNAALKVQGVKQMV